MNHTQNRIEHREIINAKSEFNTHTFEQQKKNKPAKG